MDRGRDRWRILWVVVLGGFSLFACWTPQTWGREGNICYPNGTCNDGLVCLSNLCVAMHDGWSPDAAQLPDAMVILDAAVVPPDASGCGCNPVAQAGCGGGEKCTWIVDWAGPPPLGHTGCAVNGTVAGGGACTSPETGADDCVAGYYCLNAVCTEICASAPNSCSADWICNPYPNFMEDVDNVGLCNPSCDPVQQDCVNPAEACYLQVVNGESFCAGVPAGAEGLTQGDACYGPEMNECYLNGCDEGYGANLPPEPGASTMVCAFFCNPIDNWMGNVQGLSGDPTGITCAFDGAWEGRPSGPGPAYECRYIQTFYGSTDLVPAHIGMCLGPSNWEGSCQDFDYDQLVSDIADGTAENETYCEDHPDRCMFDCISLATLEALFQ